jgi:hypothetical protein
VCCIGPTCTGNVPATGADHSYFSSNVDFFQHYDNNHNTVYNFQCGTGKHSKSNANNIVVSGTDNVTKQAVCCDDDVVGMCSGNTRSDQSNGLDMSAINGGNGCTSNEAGCAFQFRCGSHSQLKSTSATITLSGATAAGRKAVCCDTTTPANAAFFDKCSTITTRLANVMDPRSTSWATSLAPEITFCGVGREYDATKAESTCAAGQCNQNTTADISTCCKASTPCVHTDGISANTVQCQVRTHTHFIFRHNDLNTKQF